MKFIIYWNKTNCKQEKENSSRAWKEAFTYEIILLDKSQSQGDQVITKYQDKTWCQVLWFNFTEDLFSTLLGERQ